MFSNKSTVLSLLVFRIILLSLMVMISCTNTILAHDLSMSQIRNIVNDELMDDPAVFANKIKVDIPVRPDSEIPNNINKTFAQIPATEALDISTSFQDGVAPLTSTAAAWQESKLTAKIARNIHGVGRLSKKLTTDQKMTKLTHMLAKAQAQRNMKNDTDTDFDTDLEWLPNQSLITIN
jgi:hypothetical protein